MRVPALHNALWQALCRGHCMQYGCLTHIVFTSWRTRINNHFISNHHHTW
jgi:hypothetical protein